MRDWERVCRLVLRADPEMGVATLSGALEVIERQQKSRIVQGLRDRFPEPTKAPGGYVNPHDIIALIERGEV